MRDVPEESLMLTGDENIVDVDFSVLWKVKPLHVGDFLFNIQNAEGTVKAVAESAMREVIGRRNIQLVLTTDRSAIEAEVKQLIQDVLNSYKSGVEVRLVQLQKVDPPGQVIEAFRDVQAARQDQDRLRNEAETYASRVVPEARGEAARIVQEAEAYRERVVAEANGQASRFNQVFTRQLLDGALAALAKHGVADAKITVDGKTVKLDAIPTGAFATFTIIGAKDGQAREARG